MRRATSQEATAERAGAHKREGVDGPTAASLDAAALNALAVRAACPSQIDPPLSAADERTSGSKDGSIVHADKPERAVRVTSEFESHFPHMMQCRYQVALGDLENAIKEPELEPWFERVTERGPKTFEAMCLLLRRRSAWVNTTPSGRSSGY